MEIIMNDIYKLKDFGLICEKGHANPLTPTIENKTLSIPGKQGIYNFGNEIRERTFEIPLTIIRRDRIGMQHALRNFISFLFDDYGIPQSIKIAFDYEPDKYYNVTCNSQISIERALQVGRFTISLIAYNPHAYSTVYSNEIFWGSENITFESSYSLGHSGSQSLITITEDKILNYFVDGMAVKPIIEISGTASSLVLSANAHTISIPSFTNSKWVIDCDNYIVLKDEVNGFGLVNLREFTLLPGNNSLQLSGTGMNFTLQIKFRDMYI